MTAFAVFAAIGGFGTFAIAIYKFVVLDGEVRWSRIAYLLLVISLVIGGVLLWSWGRSPAPSLAITFPDDGSEVPRRITVQGSSDNLSETDVIRVAIYPLTNDRYYPIEEPAEVSATGAWSLQASIGLDEASGRFDVVALVADLEGNRALQKYLEQATSAQDWPGLVSLPPGVVTHDRVSVDLEPLPTTTPEAAPPPQATQTPEPTTRPEPTPTPTPTPTPEPTPVMLRLSPIEAEDGSGDGTQIARSNASGQATTLLQTGQVRSLNFQAISAGRVALVVRYSNDNLGPLEVVELLIDGTSIGRFDAQDTGDGGFGWNEFVTTQPMLIDVTAGPHVLSIAITGGDGGGVEIDSVSG